MIVGTGAGGATAARVLSEAGLPVIMLEEGPHAAPEERPRALLDAMTQSMRDLGTLSTSGSAPFPLLAGALRRRQHGDQLRDHLAHAGRACSATGASASAWATWSRSAR